MVFPTLGEINPHHSLMFLFLFFCLNNVFVKGDGGILPEGENPAHSTLDLSALFLFQTLIKDFKDWSPRFPHNALTDFPLGGSWCQAAHSKWPGPSKRIKHVSLSPVWECSALISYHCQHQWNVPQSICENWLRWQCSSFRLCGENCIMNWVQVGG